MVLKEERARDQDPQQDLIEHVLAAMKNADKVSPAAVAVTRLHAFVVTD